MKWSLKALSLYRGLALLPGHSSTYTHVFVSILEVAFSVMVKWHL